MAGRMLLTITRLVQLGDWNGFFQRLPLSLSFFYRPASTSRPDMRKTRPTITRRVERDNRDRSRPGGPSRFRVSVTGGAIRFATRRSGPFGPLAALFYDTCSLAKLTRSRLTDSFSTLPHWLRMEVDQYVDTRLYLPPLRRSNLQFAICRVLG